VIERVILVILSVEVLRLYIRISNAERDLANIRENAIRGLTAARDHWAAGSTKTIVSSGAGGVGDSGGIAAGKGGAAISRD